MELKSDILCGSVVLNTRPRSQAAELTRLLEQRGAKVEEVALLEIIPLLGEERQQEISRTLKPGSWLLFTSANGVRGVSKIELGRKRIAVIGDKTALALEGLGVKADFVAQGESSSEAFAEEFIDFLSDSDRAFTQELTVTFFRGRTASAKLPKMLRGAGLVVQEFVVYDAVLPRDSVAKIKRIIDGISGGVSGAVNLVIFTSSESVRNFCMTAEEAVGGTKSEEYQKMLDVLTVVIGRKTEQSARGAGFRHVLTASRASAEGIVERIVEHFGLR